MRNMHNQKRSHGYVVRFFDAELQIRIHNQRLAWVAGHFVQKYSPKIEYKKRRMPALG